MDKSCKDRLKTIIYYYNTYYICDCKTSKYYKYSCSEKRIKHCKDRISDTENGE